jgi:hypothetical protein
MPKKSLLRFAIQLRLQAQGSPSVANPLSGTKVHRTFVWTRFAPGSFLAQKRKTQFPVFSMSQSLT